MHPLTTSLSPLCPSSSTPRDMQQQLQQGVATGMEPFADLAARVKAAALDTFERRFRQDVQIQDMPWTGKVRKKQECGVAPAGG